MTRSDLLFGLVFCALFALTVLMFVRAEWFRPAFEWIDHARPTAAKAVIVMFGIAGLIGVATRRRVR